MVRIWGRKYTLVHRRNYFFPGDSELENNKKKKKQKRQVDRKVKKIICAPKYKNRAVYSVSTINMLNFFCDGLS